MEQNPESYNLKNMDKSLRKDIITILTEILMLFALVIFLFWTVTKHLKQENNETLIQNTSSIDDASNINHYDSM